MLDVAGGAEELAGRIERAHRYSAGQDAAAGRCGDVVGTAEPGDGVEQHDDVAAHFHQPLGPLDGEFRPRDVLLGGLIEGGGDDLAVYRPLQVGDLFRPFPDEHDHQVDFRMVRGDRRGDRLEHHGLAGLGRRHDETALALADRAHQVDDPRYRRAARRLEAQALLWVKGCQRGEVGALDGLLGFEAVDGVEAGQHGVFVPRPALAGGLDGALDVVALAQPVLADLGDGQGVCCRRHQGCPTP